MPSTFKPIVAILGQNYDTLFLQPTAAQTFKSGDFVKQNAAGTVDVAAAAGAAVGAVDLVGMSLGSAADVLSFTDTKARRVPIAIPRQNTDFILPLVATAAEDAATLALTDLDSAAKIELDLCRSTNGRWVLQADTATNPKFRIMGLYGVDELNNNYGVSTYPWVRCRPILSAWTHSGA